MTAPTPPEAKPSAMRKSEREIVSAFQFAADRRMSVCAPTCAEMLALVMRLDAELCERDARISEAVKELRGASSWTREEVADSLEGKK